MKSVSVQLMAFTLALCPFALSMLFHTGYPPVPLAIAAPKLPSLSFDQYGIDLKTIKTTVKNDATYLFENRGKHPVRITQLTASCGCMTPLLQGARNNEIGPGEIGRILVRLQPETATPGPHTYEVQVKYQDPEPQEVVLALKLEIPATIWVNPPVIGVYHPEGSLPTTKIFKVTDGRGKRFEVTELSVDNENVEAVIGETSRTALGNFEQEIHVQVAGALPTGRSRAIISMKTTDADIPVLRATIFMEGPRPEPAEAEPAPAPTTSAKP